MKFESEELRKEFQEELNRFPDVTVTYEAKVEGEEEIFLGSILTITITLTRENQPEKTQSKISHTPYYPLFKEEKWHIYLAGPEKQIFFYELVIFFYKTSEIEPREDFYSEMLNESRKTS